MCHACAMSRRIFLSHLFIILVTCLVFAGVLGLVSPEFYQRQLDNITVLATEEWLWLRVSLEEGQRRTVLLSLLVSLPFAALLAAGTAYWETRRISSAVEELAQGSREVAEGNYAKRLAERGDELGEIAHHFNQMARALERADEDRRQLINAVVHEVRTPLSNLRSHAEALADGVMSSEEVASVLVREVNMLHRITDDLLLVTRLAAGESAVQLSQEQPRDLVNDAFERFVHAFEDHGRTLNLTLPDVLPVVLADRERVGQVFGNLLTNALLYTPKGTAVVIGAEARRSGVRFFVSDDGPGISAEHRPHLFARFYRADAGRNRQDQRMGVGLTVAKGLVEAMDGTIGVESTSGEGSTFFFTLPRAA